MKRPHLVLAGLLALLFIYVLSTDVYDRYSATLSLYFSVRQRSQSLIDPASLPVLRAKLLAERDSISNRIMASRNHYPQTETGVIQFITEDAHREHIALKSISPGTELEHGQFSDFEFDMSVRATFFRTAALVEDLESSPTPFRIKEIKMQTNPFGGGLLETSCTGSALLYHGYDKERY